MAVSARNLVLTVKEMMHHRGMKREPAGLKRGRGICEWPWKYFTLPPSLGLYCMSRNTNESMQLLQMHDYPQPLQSLTQD